MNIFIGTGNLGSDPVLSHKDIRDEKRAVVNFSVFFKRSKPDGQGGFEDAGGFWRDVSLWGPRAEKVAKTFQKGAPVVIVGEEKQDSWEDKDSGEARAKIVVIAEHIGLDPIGIESVTFQKRSEG
ncbi:MAG: single-stranded DNA-binding protein [Gammaproteobacteria bacterium]|nr:single-stranded DNA-binding protein [Gammaproteobacteria bacterium]